MSEHEAFSVDHFSRAFQDFLVNINRHVSEDSTTDLVATRVRDFMGSDLRDTHVVSEEYPHRDLPNIHLALETYLNEEGRSAELLGFAVEHGYLDSFGLSALADDGAVRGMGSNGLMVGPVTYRSVETADEVYLQCIQSGMYLIQDGERRLVLMLKGSSRLIFKGQVSLEVMACDRLDAEHMLGEIRRLVREKNIYRGRVISLVPGGYGVPPRIVFHRLPEVSRGDIVLPEDLLVRIERNTLGFTRRVAQLRAAGRHIRRGLLFHGPPGTGKTLTSTYLAGRLRGERTILLLTAQSLNMFSEAVSVARALAPAMVIMEDVDLVAEDREFGGHHSAVLYDLLNEMDGLSSDVDILFILTTNRPKVLEPALVSRPGRVDQAFEFMLPDLDARRRLFTLYSQGLDLQLEDPERLYRKTEGASPSFVRELLRKATLFASEDADGFELPPVTDRHIELALSEMVISGGELTKSLLGASRLDSQTWTLTGQQRTNKSG